MPNVLLKARRSIGINVEKQVEKDKHLKKDKHQRHICPHCGEPKIAHIGNKLVCLKCDWSKHAE